MTDRWQPILERNINRYVEEWKRLLSFPSISADPERAEDCRKCAEWIGQHLAGMGFASRLLPTRSLPSVYAERRGPAGSPTVLFYGHYDVQPVDPLALWASPPFEPHIRNGRLYARGAADNKGQFLYVLKALEALIAEDALNVTVRVLIEGEEESGSVGATASLEEWRDLLRADVLLVTDVNMAPSGAPAITMGLRGVAHLTVAVEGPATDLHSGVHGGVAPNPAVELARLLATLHGPDGRVAAPGFYDGVRPPSDSERAQATQSQGSPEAYRRATGVPPTGGESGYGPAERAGFRPCLDINGLLSGYAGAGMKTIIPARAMAKLSLRVVPDQDPARCLQAVARHLERNVRQGLRLTVEEQGVGGSGFRLAADSELVRTAGQTLEDVSGSAPAFLWEGASIPIVAALARAAQAQPLLVGFGSEEDKPHAPNESFSLRQFEMGFQFAAEFFTRLPRLGTAATRQD
jgi:acetylornithine deacetylase/succinyl-diaminopimelate desuccinylase-like protein